MNINTRLIPVGRNGSFAFVDSEDFEYINQWKWCLDKDGYAVCNIRKNGKSSKLSMHRLINKTPSEYPTDHINHKKLDNRKCNLRTVTQRQNNQNMPKRNNNTSGYVGVVWLKSINAWTAKIRKDDKVYSLGYFETKEDAAVVYNQKAIELYGSFASLNKSVMHRINEVITRKPKKANKGTENNRAKLTDKQVLEIFKNKNTKDRVLAEKYGVSVPTIAGIQSGRQWSHITGFKYTSKKL